ncbi:hypothetical protein ABBQ38_011204 [Trebouxia sp. C0009 RCD-2024]
MLPAPRPAFGQVQDTALQPDATANNMGHQSQAHSQSQLQSQSHPLRTSSTYMGHQLQSYHLRTSSSYEHAASVNSADHFTFPSTSHHLENSPFGNNSEMYPAGRHSLSDGIPPAFETSSSCAASASLLFPTIGRQFSIPHLATGKRLLLSRSGSSLHVPRDVDGDLEGLVVQLSEGTPEERGQAAEKLFNKAADDEHARQNAAAAGVIPPLVRLLHDGRERGRMYACYALSSILSTKSGVTEIRAAGVIPALIHVLNSTTAAASKKGAMRALGRVVRNDEAANEVVAAGGLAPVTALLNSNDAAVVRRCLIVLYSIGADKEVLQGEIVTAGAVPAVVRLCTSTDPALQAEATDLLKVLARNSRAATTIVQEGALPALAAAAGEGLSDRARLNASKAIQRLAGMHSVEAMVRSSPAGRFLDSQASEAAMLNQSLSSIELAKPPSFESQLLLHDEREAPGHEASARPRGGQGRGMVAPLVHLLVSGGPSDQARAARALSNMATDSSVKEQIVAAGAVSLLIDIVRDGGSAVQSAVVALEKLCSQASGMDAIMEHSGITALLILLNNGHMEAWSSATHTLHMLCSATPDAAVMIIQAGGVTALMHACAGSPAELQIALLTVLRQLVVQPTGPEAFLVARALPVLAMLQHSLVAEVRILSTKILERVAASSSSAEDAIAQEQLVQEGVNDLVEQLRVAVVVPPPLEAAFRLVPRSAFLVSHAALGPEQGQSFLDIGSGTGYLTMVAASLVGHTGRAVGLELDQAAVEYAAGKLHQVKKARGLPTLSAVFLCGNIFSENWADQLGGPFDCVHVGGSCAKERIHDLMRLVKEGGRMTVPCEGQLLLLTPPFDDLVPEPIVLGTMQFCPGLMDEHGKQMASEAWYGHAADHTSGQSTTIPWRPPTPVQHPWTGGTTSVSGGDHHDSGRMVLHGGRLPGGPPVDPLPSDQLRQEARLMARYDEGSAPSDATEEEAEGEAHGWLIAREDISICRTSENKKCRLGEGGFGVVYKALMNGVDEVAVKLVKADKPTNKELTLFHKEVRVLRTLHHRNIVQFYGACLEPSSMFFVTELMKGGDLYSALRNHPDTMQWDRLGRKVALDVALGINYLHTRRPPMMHRDLKSPNVLLSEEGVAKIADVGMVRPQVQDLVTAQPIMTPLWAAPEVVRHERASVKADMWSYGILVWELISNQDITNLQPLAIAQAMQAGTSKSLQLPADCPPVAARIFTECTHTEPDCRPSAQRVVEWLRQS